MLPVTANVPLAGSYSSALAIALLSSDAPPAISTVPSGSNVAVWPLLATVMLPVAVNVPAAGSYSSALAISLLGSDAPPAMSTFPFDNNVAVYSALATVMLPVAVNVPAAGSYSSALTREFPLTSPPPAMSTIPLGNNVAVCPSHATVMLPVTANVPLAGSYSSALGGVTFSFSPPTMSTFPLGNNVAVCSSLATVMLPVATKTPCGAVVPVVPAELVAPPVVLIEPSPPVPPAAFIVPACCSSLGVREQARPVNDNARPIANQRHPQVMPARLSERWPDGRFSHTHGQAPSPLRWPQGTRNRDRLYPGPGQPHPLSVVVRMTVGAVAAGLSMQSRFDNLRSPCGAATRPDLSEPRPSTCAEARW